MDYNGDFPECPDPPSSKSNSPPTTPRGRKRRGNCDICGELSQGAHFGAESCRACTAFFRRSVAQNREYSCRNGKACTVQARNRRMCRSCRFERCIKAGMKKTAVQQYESDENDASEECPPVVDKGVEKNESITPILTRMAQMYEEVKRKRKILHKKKKKLPRTVNCIESASIHLKDAGLVAEFLSKSFEETNQLEEDQKKLMFKMFPKQFIVLEGVYKASSKNKITSGMILPNGDMIDFDHPETFFPSMTGSEMISQDESVRLFYPILNLYKRCISDPMNQMKIDETEFLFLCGILFWDNSHDHQSKECETLAKTMRSRIIDEIVLYLRREKKFQEPALRISSLMIILNALQRVIFKLQQDIGMSHAFNVFKVDDSFYKLMNCVS